LLQLKTFSKPFVHVVMSLAALERLLKHRKTKLFQTSMCRQEKRLKQRANGFVNHFSSKDLCQPASGFNLGTAESWTTFYNPFVCAKNKYVNLKVMPHAELFQKSI